MPKLPQLREKPLPNSHVIPFHLHHSIQVPQPIPRPGRPAQRRPRRLIRRRELRRLAEEKRESQKKRTVILRSGLTGFYPYACHSCVCFLRVSVSPW